MDGRSLDDLGQRAVDAIAFGAGPGSFTGIRVTCGIAYGIAYANNLPIIGINETKSNVLGYFHLCSWFINFSK